MDAQHLARHRDARRLGLLFALVGTFALGAIGAAPTFAAVADTNTQVTLGPGGSVVISGTIECDAGAQARVTTTLRQRGPGGEYKVVAGSFPIQVGMQFTVPCPGSGPLPWSVGPLFSSRPFHPGPGVVQTTGNIVGGVCGFFPSCISTETKEVRITRG